MDDSNIFDLLINPNYGLGIPEENIDKFQFYKVAQYCDGVDAATGKWYGVDGFSDGSYRHKPRTKFGTVRETLLGINEGIAIKERRFILDLLLSDQQQAFDLLNQICGTLRSIIIYSGGKLSLQIDMPDEVPIMVFNETNMKPDSVTISGISESDIITGVDINYINLLKNYGEEQIKNFKYKDRLINFSANVDNNENSFEDTKEIIRNLDLVITSCTAIAHLSSTMNIKTWILISYSPDWRWFLKFKNSPWYEHMKIYRQNEIDEWKPGILYNSETNQNRNIIELSRYKIIKDTSVWSKPSLVN